MVYVLLDSNNVVIQKQRSFEKGFIEVSDDVVCGQIFDGTNFINPPASQPSVEEQIESNKSYLMDTDWIVAKISEVQLLGGDTSTLLSQYADILTAREVARTNINTLEANI